METLLRAILNDDRERAKKHLKADCRSRNMPYRSSQTVRISDLSLDGTSAIPHCIWRPLVTGSFFDSLPELTFTSTAASSSARREANGQDPTDKSVRNQTARPASFRPVKQPWIPDQTSVR